MRACVGSPNGRRLSASEAGAHWAIIDSDKFGDEAARPNRWLDWIMTSLKFPSPLPGYGPDNNKARQMAIRCKIAVLMCDLHRKYWPRIRKFKKESFYSDTCPGQEIAIKAITSPRPCANALTTRPRRRRKRRYVQKYHNLWHSGQTLDRKSLVVFGPNRVSAGPKRTKEIFQTRKSWRNGVIKRWWKRWRTRKQS